MKTTEYLDAVKDVQNLRSDSQLARLLSLDRANITLYRKKRRVMDDYIACKVAKLLDIDEMEVIAQAHAEREKDAEKRQYWQTKAQKCREATGSSKWWVVLGSNQ